MENKKKSVKTDSYLENMLYVLIPKQIQPKRKVMEISFNEMQQTVFFRQLACTAVKHTTSAHHCLYLFALSDSINVCVSRHTVVGENSSQPMSLIEISACLGMHACIPTCIYSHLIPLQMAKKQISKLLWTKS